MSELRRLAALILGIALVAGCGSLQATSAPSDRTVPPDQMELVVSNETSIDLELVVNDKAIRTLPAGQLTITAASALPPLPWTAEVRLPGGRALVMATVHTGDVWSRPNSNGGIEAHGTGARVDLSCGRIDVYSGPPMLGPGPGTGSPGDCDP